MTQIKSLAKKLNYVALILIAFFLPFSKQWITYFLGFYILTWLIEGNFKYKFSSFKDYRLSLILSFYLIGVVSHFISKDKELSASILQVQLSIVLLPIIFISSSSLRQEKKNNILYSFLLGLVVFAFYILYTLLKTNIELVKSDSLNNIFNIKDIIQIIGHHTYLSLHFTIGIVISVFFLSEKNNLLKRRVIQVSVILLYIFVILLLHSRAALVTLMLLALIYYVKYFKKINLYINILVFLVLIFAGGLLFQKSRLSDSFNWFLSKKNVCDNKTNLLDNGDFSEGLLFWNYSTSGSVKHEVIETELGNAIRISKGEKACRFSLKYNGRQPIYYKNVKYVLSFDFKVIKGENVPFKVGWWLEEEGFDVSNLPKNISSVGNGWYNCKVDYSFKNTNKLPISNFINSQKLNTIVDFTNFNLISNDSLKRVQYVDELADLRIYIWKASIRVWTKNFLFGIGLGDSRKLLVNEYRENGMIHAAKKKFNAHNQFLETAMQTGLIGFIILVCVFAIPFYHSIKKRQELLSIFLIVCLINFLFESMLERLAGVVFFSFWYSFLWFVYYKDDKQDEITSSSNPK